MAWVLAGNTAVRSRRGNKPAHINGAGHDRGAVGERRTGGTREVQRTVHVEQTGVGHCLRGRRSDVRHACRGIASVERAGVVEIGQVCERRQRAGRKNRGVEIVIEHCEQCATERSGQQPVIGNDPLAAALIGEIVGARRERNAADENAGIVDVVGADGQRRRGADRKRGVCSQQRISVVGDQPWSGVVDRNRARGIADRNHRIGHRTGSHHCTGVRDVGDAAAGRRRRDATTEKVDDVRALHHVDVGGTASAGGCDDAALAGAGAGHGGAGVVHVDVGGTRRDRPVDAVAAGAGHVVGDRHGQVVGRNRSGDDAIHAGDRVLREHLHVAARSCAGLYRIDADPEIARDSSVRNHQDAATRRCHGVDAVAYPNGVNRIRNHLDSAGRAARQDPGSSGCGNKAANRVHTHGARGPLRPDAESREGRDATARRNRHGACRCGVAGVNTVGEAVDRAGRIHSDGAEAGCDAGKDRHRAGHERSGVRRDADAAARNTRRYGPGLHQNGTRAGGHGLDAVGGGDRAGEAHYHAAGAGRIGDAGIDAKLTRRCGGANRPRAGNLDTAEAVSGGDGADDIGVDRVVDVDDSIAGIRRIVDHGVDADIGRIDHAADCHGDTASAAVGLGEDADGWGEDGPGIHLDERAGIGRHHDAGRAGSGIDCADAYGGSIDRAVDGAAVHRNVDTTRPGQVDERIDHREALGTAQRAAVDDDLIQAVESLRQDRAVDDAGDGAAVDRDEAVAVAGCIRTDAAGHDAGVDDDVAVAVFGGRIDGELGKQVGRILPRRDVP